MRKNACKTVERAIRDHFDTYARVRAVCSYGSVNLDLHAARVTLSIADRRRQQQGQQPHALQQAATGPDEGSMP